LPVVMGIFYVHLLRRVWISPMAAFWCSPLQSPNRLRMFWSPWASASSAWRCGGADARRAEIPGASDRFGAGRLAGVGVISLFEVHRSVNDGRSRCTIVELLRRADDGVQAPCATGSDTTAPIAWPAPVVARDRPGRPPSRPCAVLRTRGRTHVACGRTRLTSHVRTRHNAHAEIRARGCRTADSPRTRLGWTAAGPRLFAPRPGRGRSRALPERPDRALFPQAGAARSKALRPPAWAAVPTPWCARTTSTLLHHRRRSHAR